MKYFLDTEFHEGFHKPLFSRKRHFIDFISIGIVAEDGREYYAISKDFDVKAAWNACDKKVNENYKPSLGGGFDSTYNPMYVKTYWLRENVLKPLFEELKFEEYMSLTDEGVLEFTDIIREYSNREEQLNFFKQEFLYGMKVADWIFNLSNFKKTINKYGKSNKQIAEEIKDFCKSGTFDYEMKPSPTTWHQNTLHTQVIRTNPEFYGYYSDYDWVVFSSLFGKMIDLPKGFPMVCFDIQQMICENEINKDILLKEIPQTNEHNSLSDAMWNFKAHQWIKNNINEKGR